MFQWFYIIFQRIQIYNASLWEELLNWNGTFLTLKLSYSEIYYSTDPIQILKPSFCRYTCSCILTSWRVNGEWTVLILLYLLTLVVFLISQSIFTLHVPFAQQFGVKYLGQGHMWTGVSYKWWSTILPPEPQSSIVFRDLLEQPDNNGGASASSQSVGTAF